MEKFSLQDRQYDFPYHYLPGFSDPKTPYRVRGLQWGFEYLCYQLHSVGIARDLMPQSVLEVGCGDGRFLGLLGESVPRRLGIDLSERAIRFAQAFHPEIEFRCQDLDSVAEQFDLVAAIEVLEHVPDREVVEFLDAMIRRARPRGYVLLSVPTDVVPTHPKHYRHYNANMVRDVAGKGGLSVLSLDHVYDPHSWAEAWFKWTCNRRLSVDIAIVNRWIWRYIWGRRRFARPWRGRHIVALLRKPR